MGQNRADPTDRQEPDRTARQSRGAGARMAAPHPDRRTHGAHELEARPDLLPLARAGGGGARGEAGLRRDVLAGRGRAAAGRAGGRRRRPGLRRLRPGRRLDGHAEHRRRAAPLRLERVQLGALPEHPAPARRAPLPARAGAALVPHPLRRRQGRPAQPQDRQGHRARRATSKAPATAARTRSTAAPTASTSPTSAPRTATTAPAASPCSTTTPSRSRAQWEVDRGDAVPGLRLLVAPQPRRRWSPASGARRR